jgi:hypothetical protein
MSDSANFKGFWEVWHELYRELCVLQCLVYGLSRDELPDKLELGLSVQVDQLFNLHEQVFKTVKAFRVKKTLAKHTKENKR